MRSVLVGAVDSTRVTLEALVRRDVPPLALVTLPQEKAHRHSDFVDVAGVAKQHGIPVIETSNSNSRRVIDQLVDMQLDWIFVVGWSQICKPGFIDIPKRGVVGYHPSALPRNRGRGVIPWTILQGCDETGASLFWIDKGVDSGDLILQQSIVVADDETARSLYNKHLATLESMWDSLLSDFVADSVARTKQDASGATWCAKRTPADGLIDWSQPAADVWRLIRAVGEPYPGAFTYYNHARLVVWEASLVLDSPYIGLPGQIQRLTDDGPLVQCGDGQHVLLSKFEVEGRPNGPATNDFKLKIHSRLGIDWLSVYDHVRSNLN